MKPYNTIYIYISQRIISKYIIDMSVIYVSIYNITINVSINIDVVINN